MFKKLVTNLPYSPGLLNQVGFYAKRLKQEEFVRRIGLIFGVLALLLNLNLALFSPESSVLASPANDVVTGGIYGSSTAERQNKTIAAIRSNPYTKAIFDYYGITETDIRNTTTQKISTGDGSYRSVGRQSFGRGAEACRTHRGYYFCERSMNAAYRYRTLNVNALVGLRSSKVGKSDPWFAILESCGNVVIRTGKDENVTISKALKPDSPKYVKPGDTSTIFKITVKSNNANGVTNPVITDQLPEHTEYVSHSPRDLYDKVSVSGRNVTLSSSRSSYGIGPNQENVVYIRVKILNTAPDNSLLCNRATVKSQGDNAASNTNACVRVKIPKPEPECVSLRMFNSNRAEDYRNFEAVVDADGAKVSEYVFDFGDGEKSEIKTDTRYARVTHQFEPGTYTIKVLVKTSEGDVGNTGTCVTKLTINEQTPEPSVTCEYIRLIQGSDSELKREFEVAATPQNGATVTDYVVDFGDGKQATIANTSEDKATVSHDYEKSGEYTAKVTARTSLGDVTNDSSCILKVSIDEQPCEYDETLPKGHPDCLPPENPEPHVTQLKQAENLTQGIEDAHGTTAKAGDSIKYTLLTENDGTGTYKGYVVREDMGDVLQYADIVDVDGGQLSENGYVITWPAADIKAGETLSKTITVKIKSPIPNTPVSASDPLAFDSRLENAYGNNVTINVPKSPPKQIEETVTDLPNTGAGMNAFISTAFVMGVTYFYFRNRLISKELGLIRKEFSGGVV